MESFFASGPDEGEMFPIGDRLGTARVLGELPEAEAAELTFQPGWEGVAPHSHDDHTDSFYVLEGEVEFLVGGELNTGGFALQQTMQEQTVFVVASPQDLTVQCFNAPPNAPAGNPKINYVDVTATKVDSSTFNGTPN